jgi:hypothetical protein
MLLEIEIPAVTITSDGSANGSRDEAENTAVPGLLLLLQ